MAYECLYFWALVKASPHGSALSRLHAVKCIMALLVAGMSDCFLFPWTASLTMKFTSWLTGLCLVCQAYGHLMSPGWATRCTPCTCSCSLGSRPCHLNLRWPQMTVYVEHLKLLSQKGHWRITHLFLGLCLPIFCTCACWMTMTLLAESIAFYKGESREASQASSRLLRLVVTIVRKIQWQAGLDLWKHIYVYATMLLPALWMAPRYFAGAIEFGVITQVSLRTRSFR